MTQRGNPAQREAIAHAAGPCQILAGPGSGKTFVLTEHIRYLILQLHAAPSSILVLTFSRAAALEMKRRFQALCGAFPDSSLSSAAASVVFGTFHSVFFHILRQSLPHPPSVLGAAERQALILHLIRCHVPRCPEEELPHLLELCLPMIARIKARPDVYSGSDALPNDETFQNFLDAFPGPECFLRIYRDYCRFLEENHKTDFEGMILGCLRLFQQDPELLSRWRNRFRWILVDEFQDIDPPQYELLRLLSGSENPGLFVVGDDDQAIYGFRGADSSVMRRMTEDYPLTRRIFLDVNYRCSESIVRFSQLLIQENRLRVPKRMQAGGQGGAPVLILPFSDAGAEYAFLCGTLQALTPEALAQTAVICRSRAQTASLKRVLCRRGLSAGDSAEAPDPLRRSVFLDILSYLRLAQCLSCGRPLSCADFFRVMNRPQRFLSRRAVAGDASHGEAAFRIGEVFCMEELKRFYRGQPPMLRSIRTLEQDLSCLALLRPALAVRYLRHAVGYEAAAADCSTRSPEAYTTPPGKEAAPGRGPAAELSGQRRERVHAALDEAERCVSRAETAEEAAAALSALIAAASPNETVRKEPPPCRALGPQVITMHASKGLEFDRVFLPDLNEGILPGRQIRSEEGMEEERRLLYVAMTRAKRELTLLYLSGTPENPRRPSRFLRVLGVEDPMEKS
ncbi:ATP-dependent helicase [Lachnoclostridium sp. Marseille-P6806]|uniref:ATP-dependent helicase n=1 Tax=Lachnoclostridium sp. Marseille-P6806 TaxID=2364793 RepID=UPI001030C77C|nr:ATP-dependent helicase [Lachnoclostridium sp. Marseille-P6806]